MKGDITQRTAVIAVSKGYPFDKTRDVEWVPIAQSKLQQWLREAHGLHPHLCWIEGLNWCVDVYKFKEENGLMNRPCQFTGFAEFEDALETGLQHMLSIIK